MIGWLPDTNVVAELANPHGAACVHAWAAAQDERRLYLSVLTPGEYEEGPGNLPEGSVIRPRVEAAPAALEARFAGRLLSMSDAVVRRWGAVSDAVKRATGQTPPVIDTMLATTALEHELYLVTRNIRDVQHSGASVFNPWTDDPAAFREPRHTQSITAPGGHAPDWPRCGEASRTALACSPSADASAAVASSAGSAAAVAACAFFGG